MAIGVAGAAAPQRKLQELIREATVALAHLDTERLEELAISCRKLTAVTPEEAKKAAADMALFGGVLQATRANADVLERLKTLAGVPQVYMRAQKESALAGTSYGHD